MAGRRPFLHAEGTSSGPKGGLGKSPVPFGHPHRDKRIAGHLDDIAAVFRDLVDERLVERVEQPPKFFGPARSLLCQGLGERREPRNVGVEDGRLDLRHRLADPSSPRLAMTHEQCRHIGEDEFNGRCHFGSPFDEGCGTECAEVWRAEPAGSLMRRCQELSQVSHRRGSQVVSRRRSRISSGPADCGTGETSFRDSDVCLLIAVSAVDCNALS